MTERHDSSGPRPPRTDPSAGDRSVAHDALETPVGCVRVTCSDRAVLRLEWSSDDSDTPVESDRLTVRTAADDLLAEALAQLRAYFDGHLGDFDLPIDFGQVSEVARTVLTTLAEEVPAGTTMTYGELAEATGTGIPARAVGGIMGLNPIPLIVPCHRIVAGDGLGGYSGGLPGHELETKRRLLEFEDALPQPLF